MALSTILRASGSVLPDAFGASQLFQAASKGDVSTLALLIKHAGLNVCSFFRASALSAITFSGS
jgi:hypothetical protein